MTKILFSTVPILFLSILSLSISIDSECAYAVPDQKKQELPPTGSLSTSKTSRTVNNSVPDTWGEDSGDTPPITGSVSKLNNDTWIMRVFNNSEDLYSVNLDIIQKNERGSVVKSDSYSYNLKPKEKEEKRISAGVGASEASLNLRSYKNLSEKRKALKEATTPAPESKP